MEEVNLEEINEAIEELQIERRQQEQEALQQQIQNLQTEEMAENLGLDVYGSQLPGQETLTEAELEQFLIDAEETSIMQNILTKARSQTRMLKNIGNFLNPGPAEQARTGFGHNKAYYCTKCSGPTKCKECRLIRYSKRGKAFYVKNNKKHYL